MNRKILALVVAVFAASCSGITSLPTDNPVSPTPSSSGSYGSVAGAWSGSATDSSGQGKMAWTVTLNGDSLIGSMSLNDPSLGLVGDGSVSGTVNGTTVSFQLDVASGGFSGAMSQCSLAASGQATMSADGRTLTGTYSGTMNGLLASGPMAGQPCGGTISNGQFTLTR